MAKTINFQKQIVINPPVTTFHLSTGVTTNTKFKLQNKAATFAYEPNNHDNNPWTNGTYAEINFKEAIAIDSNYGL